MRHNLEGTAIFAIIIAWEPWLHWAIAIFIPSAILSWAAAIIIQAVINLEMAVIIIASFWIASALIQSAGIIVIALYICSACSLSRIYINKLNPC